MATDAATVPGGEMPSVTMRVRASAPAHVEERAARVAWVDARIGLDEAVIAGLITEALHVLARAPFGRHDTGRHRV